MNKPRTILGIILIFIGVGIFLDVNVFRFVIPAVLIYWGYQALTGSTSRFNSMENKQVSLDTLNEAVIFSAMNHTVESTDFQGGKVTAVFGGGKLDLSKVSTKAKSVDLEINTVFGGLEVIVPKNWRVHVNSAAVIGGVTQNTAPVKSADVDLNIKGAAVFGGVEIKQK